MPNLDCLNGRRDGRLLYGEEIIHPARVQEEGTPGTHRQPQEADGNAPFLNPLDGQRVGQKKVPNDISLRNSKRKLQQCAHGSCSVLALPTMHHDGPSGRIGALCKESRHRIVAESDRTAVMCETAGNLR